MPGQNRPAGELDGSPLSDGGVNVRSSVGAARKYCGLCRNGSCGLKATMTNAPINVATPVAIRAKKNLVIYSGGLSSLLFSHAMCDLIGSSPSTTRSHVGHSNVCIQSLAPTNSSRQVSHRLRYFPGAHSPLAALSSSSYFMRLPSRQTPTWHRSRPSDH